MVIFMLQMRISMVMITALYKSNSILVTNASTSNIESTQEIKILDLNGIYFEENTDILN